MDPFLFTPSFRALALATTAFFPLSAAAQDSLDRVLKDPPLLLQETETGPMARLTALAPTPRSTADEVVYDLDIDYIQSEIWNPATLRFDTVNLRGYSGDGVDLDAPYVAPSIYARPGDTVRMTLNNNLPEDVTCNNWDRDVNIPHCFNTTNMHTHGLWINPAGNSDNVLLSINPGVSFQYEYNIPPSHPAGTFWYHPHRHGSTALQVGSGMAGALVITGDRVPVTDGAGAIVQTGDIDVLLRPTEEQPFNERLLVFQQIPYACRDADGNIEGTTNEDGDIVDWTCAEGQVGTVEKYDQFGPGSWPNSGRYTSINGHVLPTITEARAGEIERWRMVHAGVRDTINLKFIKREANAPSLDEIASQDTQGYIGQYCTGQEMPFHLIAADGLTIANAMITDSAVFQPGYRWDALVTFQEAGTYCVIDADMPPPGTVDQAPRSRQLLGFVQVTPGDDYLGVQDPDSYLAEQLAMAAEINLPSNVVGQVIEGLANNLSLAAFLPHQSLADIPKSEVGDKYVNFFIDTSNSPLLFMINGKPYDPNRVDQTLTLGAIDDWTLTSDFVSHPFHIHVNPFQILKILDPYGKDVSAVDAVDDCCGTDGEIDPQFRGLKGMFKDTLWTKNAGTDADGKALRYTAIVRTHYRRYVGEFVLHCHILDHEDQGMMQNVVIALPDGRGGTAAFKHH